jgi:UDP-N-acetylglucosamine 4,6-dehydratase/5-epimerase
MNQHPPSNMATKAEPAANLNGATILVTGATGSFGRHFVKYLVERSTPRRLIVFSRDEQKQYDMALELPQERYPFLRYFIGDVRDAERLEMAMWDVDTVIHAAAMKHVSIAEYNPFECIHTNVLGAENVVRAATRLGVRRVIALSTDKAVNPINLYGASKLASDKIFIAGNTYGRRAGTLFSVVRYGNVVGSRGSVVPYFRKLIAEGADALPITDERMTRFWIGLDRGIEAVLWALGNMRGGEIFVPRIPSVAIVDLARAMAPHLKHRVVGIRPGEKLHEVLATAEDARSTVEFDDYYVIEPQFASWDREAFARNGARRVSEDFAYASDTNPHRLSLDEIRAGID